MKTACDIKQLDMYLRNVQALTKLSITVYDLNYKPIVSVQCNGDGPNKSQQEIEDFLRNSLEMKKFNMRLWKDGSEAMVAKAVSLKGEFFGFIYLDHFHFNEKVSTYCDDYHNGLIVYNATRIQCALTIIEIGIHQCIREVKKPDTNHKNHGEKIKKYIAQNLSKKLTLQDLCNEFNLSRNQISRIFREELKQSFQTYLRIERLEKAKELLSTTDLPVSDIAKQVGHPTHALFDKLFKKYVDSTPTEYRENAVKK